MTKSGLNPSSFEGTIEGKKIALYVLENAQGAEITVLNHGAKIVSLMVPDKTGKLVDVVLGHNNLAEYLNSEEPYFGAVCGRFANRIALGKFTLDGKEYNLPINNGPNSLHGGIKGFNVQVWDVKQLDKQTLELSYLSKDGEEGFPGNLAITMIYRLTDANALEIEYAAKTDKDTILNLTNHSYFNLSGAGNPTIKDHILKMDASTYLPTDDTSIPYAGAPSAVAGTAFDFTKPETIGARIDEKIDQLLWARGYDHTFVLDNADAVVCCESPVTGIVLRISTTEPGVQMYTGNWMTGNFAGKGGHHYPAQSAVCFETQHFPNAINRPDYPSVELKKGDVFKSKSIYHFSVKK